MCGTDMFGCSSGGEAIIPAVQIPPSPTMILREGFDRAGEMDCWAISASGEVIGQTGGVVGFRRWKCA